jgi:tripartite-type tricarboxylate transporter receptor subunit TctC
MFGIKRWIKTFGLSVCLMTLISIGLGNSQERYPSRPVTVVVPYTAGMADTVTRGICKVAEKTLGQPLVIENKAGGGGVVGTNYILKTEPDGYTIGITFTHIISSQPHFRKLPFNPLTDLVDICAIHPYETMLAVKSDAPWKTFDDVIAYARKNPGKFTYATAGVGSSQHIVLEMVAKAEGIQWTNIPFKGAAEAYLACLGGNTGGAASGGPPDVLPHIKAGTLRGILSLNNYRWPDLPDVPCMTDKGYDFYLLNILSFAGPKGLPEPIREKLENVFREATKDPSFIEWAKKVNAKIQFIPGKEYSQLWRKEYNRLGDTIKSLNIQEQ